MSVNLSYLELWLVACVRKYYQNKVKPEIGSQSGSKDLWNPAEALERLSRIILSYTTPLSMVWVVPQFDELYQKMWSVWSRKIWPWSRILKSAIEISPYVDTFCHKVFGLITLHHALCFSFSAFREVLKFKTFNVYNCAISGLKLLLRGCESRSCARQICEIRNEFRAWILIWQLFVAKWGIFTISGIGRSCEMRTMVAKWGAVAKWRTLRNQEI